MARRRKPKKHRAVRSTNRNYNGMRRKPGYARLLRNRKLKKRRWMKKATKNAKKGTLHRMMGIPLHKKIPTSELRRSIRVAKFWLKYPGNGGGRTRAAWKKLRARAQMALNFRKKSKTKRQKRRQSFRAKKRSWSPQKLAAYNREQQKISSKLATDRETFIRNDMRHNQCTRAQAEEHYENYRMTI